MDLLPVDPVPPNYLQLLIWTKTLEDGQSVDVLYFDFAKAFDSVPHNRLIAKLQGLGITGRLLTWLKNFLVNRKQKVVGDMITVYKLIHNMFAIDSSNFFTPATTSITRRHTLKLFKPSTTTRSRSDFLSSRAVDHWNKLPNYIVNASSIDNFKKLIDDYWTDLLYLGRENILA